MRGVAMKKLALGALVVLCSMLAIASSSIALVTIFMKWGASSPVGDFVSKDPMAVIIASVAVFVGSCVTWGIASRKLDNP